MKKEIFDIAKLRYIERMLIAVLGGPFFCFIGYKLYETGVKEFAGNLDASIGFAKFVLSGSGPGLFFMAVGAIISITGLMSGRVKYQNLEKHKESKRPLDLLVKTVNKRPKILISGLIKEYEGLMNIDLISRKTGDQNVLLSKSLREYWKELELIESYFELSGDFNEYNKLVEIKESHIQRVGKIHKPTIETRKSTEAGTSEKKEQFSYGSHIGGS